jgi:hypothetical protein
VPEAEGVLMVIVRAAMVVLDFLAGEPTTVRQSPTVTALIVTVAVSLNVVVDVQLTAVWAVVLCTSMVDPVILATLPLAPIPPPPGAEAAPAIGDSPKTREAQIAAAPVATPARRRPREPCDVIVMVFVFLPLEWVIYSLLSASIGARWAARLAG